MIDGKAVAQKIKEQVKQEIENFVEKGYRRPNLCVFIAEGNDAGKTYVRNKQKACEFVGIESKVITYPQDTTEEELISMIAATPFDGFLVQLPLPSHIDEKRIIESIPPNKDVDGFHPKNVAKLVLGQAGLRPCTPAGIIELLHSIDYDLTGKKVVIIGRSNIVGKPLALMCLQENAMVTIAHSKVDKEVLKETCRNADVIISAVGQKCLIDETWIGDTKPIVIDVGINRDENGKLCGDVNYHAVEKIVGNITPVPGGVGPMTVAMLMKNTLTAYKRNMLAHMNDELNEFRNRLRD